MISLFLRCPWTSRLLAPAGCSLPTLKRGIGSYDQLSSPNGQLLLFLWTTPSFLSTTKFPATLPLIILPVHQDSVSLLTLVFADFKDRYGKGARRTAIIVDEGQFISKVICLKMISDWFSRSWHYKMACSFRKGRDTIMLRASFYHQELN